MSDWLKLERVVNRDAVGNIMPEVIEVEGITEDDGSHPKIQVLPLSRGEFAELSKIGETGKDKDIELIKKHVLKPKLEDAAFDKMSMKTINALMYAVVEASTGMPQAMLKETSLQKMRDAQEEYLKKKQVS